MLIAHLARHRRPGRRSRSTTTRWRMIARAAEGSVRDALSILDQAIAHGAGAVDGRGGARHAGPRRPRPRRRPVRTRDDAAMSPRRSPNCRAQYDAGADPVAVLTDLAEFNHLVTRLRFVPIGGQRRLAVARTSASAAPSSPRRCRCACCRAPGRCCSRAFPRCSRRTVRSAPPRWC